MKIKIRIALIFTLLFSLIIILLSIAIYYFANERAFEDFYVRLELRANIAARTHIDTDHGNSEAYEQVRNQHIQLLPEEKEYIVSIDSLPTLAKTGLGADVPASFFQEIIAKKQATYRTGYHFFKGIEYKSKKGDYAIIISAEHTYAANFLANLKTILIIGNIIAMIVIFTIGMFFSRNVLAPIRKITREVNNISATSLHKRLAIKPGNDEISELGDTFNNMLSRLETSFETQNNFVSNASHELNTPLTSIIGEAEYALSKPRSHEQYQNGLQIILTQAEKLKNITKSLLELAQSGFTGNLSFETIKVKELVQNIKKVANSIYPDSNIVTDYSLQPENLDSLTIQGNFHLLELCLSNILLNACKYSTGKTVILALATSDKNVIFIIRDKGIGIPERDMPHIFDPFFRASNVKSSKGYGIGLPLAQNIIKLHKGIIQVASKEKEGTEVVVKIPKDYNK